MHSYSPCPETLDVPRTYREFLMEPLFQLERHPPRTIGDLGPWSEQARQRIGELIASGPLSPEQVKWATALLAHGLQSSTGWDLDYCFDILNDGLEHP